MTEIPLWQQIATVEAHIRRARVRYAEQIADGLLKQEAADYDLARLEAVLATVRRAALACELPAEMGGPAP